jgi:hypothetical protein
MIMKDDGNRIKNSAVAATKDPSICLEGMKEITTPSQYIRYPSEVIAVSS